MNPQEQTDYDKPVAYDTNGRPLYAHPAEEPHEPAAVPTGAAQPVEPPEQRQADTEAQQRHDESTKRYPDLTLVDGEYVIMEMRRHWIGLAAPLMAGTVLVLLVLGGLAAYPAIVPSGNPAFGTLLMPALLLLVLIALGAYIPIWVYRNNHFYLTNQRIIQELQVSLFSRNEETVSLGDVEDVGFKQTGVIPLMLDYGMLELSTPGNEDTYNYTYVCGPKAHIADINEAVRSFKEGRKVSWS